MAFKQKVKAPTYEVTGVIERISAKDEGNYTQVSVLVNEIWYGKFGVTLRDVTFVEGDEVTLVVHENGKYKNWDSYVVVSKASPKLADTSKEGVPYNSNQYRITYQGARNAAIELAGILISKDLLPIPTVKSKQIDAVVGFIKEVTNDFAREAWEASPEVFDKSAAGESPKEATE